MRTYQLTFQEKHDLTLKPPPDVGDCEVIPVEVTISVDEPDLIVDGRGESCTVGDQRDALVDILDLNDPAGGLVSGIMAAFNLPHKGGIVWMRRNPAVPPPEETKTPEPTSAPTDPENDVTPDDIPF